MIPIALAIISTCITGVFLSPNSSKEFIMGIVFLLSIYFLNKATYALLPDKSGILSLRIPFNQIKNTRNYVIIRTFNSITGVPYEYKIKRGNVAFILPTRGNSPELKSGILVEIPYELKILPTNPSIWFTAHSYWFTKINKRKYHPYLGKVKIYQKQRDGSV